LATISAGIRCRTTSAIRIHDIIDVTIRITVAAVTVAVDVTPAAGGAMGVTVAVDAMAVDVTEADVMAVEVIRFLHRDVTAKDVKVEVARAGTVRRLTTNHGTALRECRAPASAMNRDDR
jgi:hypothetical protein